MSELIEKAKARVARRKDLREQAAERGRLLPDEYREHIRRQFERGEAEARFIVNGHQPDWTGSEYRTVPDADFGAYDHVSVHMSSDPDLPVADRPTVLRVPTDRVLPCNGLNIGTQHVEVEIRIDPTLDSLGEHQSAYGRDIIRLREWNEQVLLHELLHVAVSRSPWWHDPQRKVSDPNGHDLIARIEVALWETGWRIGHFSAGAERAARADAGTSSEEERS